MFTTSPATIPSPTLRTRVDVDERLAGVHRDAHLELAVLDDPVADRERRAHRALGIVLVRDRRAEHRHHRVADELLHGAAALLELGAQPLVVRAQDRLDVLRVERLGARGEADEVGEEHRHDLALAPHQRTRSVGYPRRLKRRDHLVAVLEVARSDRELDLRLGDGDVHALAMVLDRDDVHALLRAELQQLDQLARAGPGCACARRGSGRRR